MSESKKKKGCLKRILIVIALVFGLIQLVPYGRDHDNPKVTEEPEWDSPETKALVERTCYDCHSNKTEWPWYSNVAPFSWLVQHDVDEGREHLNFTEWDKEQRHADEAAHEVEEGEMPMWWYPPLHPDAQLTDEEKQALIEGLKETIDD